MVKNYRLTWIDNGDAEHVDDFFDHDMLMTFLNFLHRNGKVKVHFWRYVV